MRTIRITESELNSIVFNAVQRVLNESFSRAGRVLGINYNAMKNYQLHKTPGAKTVMSNTEQLKLSCLTNEINKELPCFAPVFMEISGTEMYPVAFQFVAVVCWKDKSAVISGPLSVAGRDYKTGYIEYCSRENKFYRVAISDSRRTKRISELIPDDSDDENMSQITRFINGIKEAENQADGDIAAINAVGPTPQRTHLPYGAYPNITRSRLGIDKVK